MVPEVPLPATAMEPLTVPALMVTAFAAKLEAMLMAPSVPPVIEPELVTVVAAEPPLAASTA